MTAEPKPCPRCGCPTTGAVCPDCRSADPTWFRLTGLYHPTSNPTGVRATRNRKKAPA